MLQHSPFKSYTNLIPYSVEVGFYNSFIFFLKCFIFQHTFHNYIIYVFSTVWFWHSVLCCCMLWNTSALYCMDHMSTHYRGDLVKDSFLICVCFKIPVTVCSPETDFFCVLNRNQILWARLKITLLNNSHIFAHLLTFIHRFLTLCYLPGWTVRTRFTWTRTCHIKKNNNNKDWSTHHLVFVLSFQASSV